MANGKAGAPIGNTNGAKGKRWQNAIDSALNKRCKSDGQKALVKIAEKMLEQCDEGNMQAFNHLGDRLDGKPIQAIEGTGVDGEFVIRFTQDDESVL